MANVKPIADRAIDDRTSISMKIPFLFTILLSLLLLLILANHAYAQEPMVMEQVTPNGKVKVRLTWPEVLPDQLYNMCKISGCKY